MDELINSVTGLCTSIVFALGPHEEKKTPTSVCGVLQNQDPSQDPVNSFCFLMLLTQFVLNVVFWSGS